MADTVTIRSSGLRAEIQRRGAELVALRTAGGQDLMGSWTNEAVAGSWHSPLLFPVIGTVRDKIIRHRGRNYPMPPHGIARVNDFALEEAADLSCRLVLRDSPATRAHYPFAFALELDYRVSGSTLTITATLRNPGLEPLPASFGYHPAFRWPLEPGRAKEDYRIRFEHPEPAPIRMLRDSLLAEERAPSPVEGDRLMLRDDLFEGQQAKIFDRHISRSVAYGAPGGLGLQLDFPGMPHLGIWTRPGADYVCIEPWQGHADPEGFAGEFAEKPGAVLIGPGEARRWPLTVRVGQDLV